MSCYLILSHLILSFHVQCHFVLHNVVLCYVTSRHVGAFSNVNNIRRDKSPFFSRGMLAACVQGTAVALNVCVCFFFVASRAGGVGDGGGDGSMT